MFKTQHSLIAAILTLAVSDALAQQRICGNLPAGITLRMEERDLLVIEGVSFRPEYVLEESIRWQPGAVLRVAFFDGSTELHRKVEEAVSQIEDACRIDFDFGFDPQTGKYRMWAKSDIIHAAEIRISFSLFPNDYFSLMGTDAVNPYISDGVVGGNPGEVTLSLGGFHNDPTPADWRLTTRHEFLHALGVSHEHQNPDGPCENDFRWEDDLEYIPTRDEHGSYTSDCHGKQPGIYRYLSGPPNYWSRETIDDNLRPLPRVEGRFIGPFDRESIMLYSFDPEFYIHPGSTCMPARIGQDLSAVDIAGIRVLYGDVLKIELDENHLSKERRAARERILHLSETLNIDFVPRIREW